VNVLIVESEPELSLLWTWHLERLNAHVAQADGQESAIALLQQENFDVIIMDLVLAQGSSLAVADFASYRRPDAKVIFVTNTSFFSDGSIFLHCNNACAYVQSHTRPEDLVAMVEHYGTPTPKPTTAGL